MSKIISKLSVQNTDLGYDYLINNVIVGINLALNHKEIISHKGAFNYLKTIKEELEKMPCPPKGEIYLNDQKRAKQLGFEALAIVNDILEP